LATHCCGVEGQVSVEGGGVEWFESVPFRARREILGRWANGFG
jgi:hypothetical protein